MSWDMVLPKAMYFVNTCSAVPWGRYKVIYFHTLGFNGAQIGTIRSGTHFAKLIAWPLWGVLCDQVGSLRYSLILSLCLSTVALEYMRSVGDCPWIAPDYSIILACAVLRSAMNAGWPLVDAATLALVQRQDRHHLTPPLGPANTPLEPKQQEGYGQQRLWGAVAWGLASLLVGVTIDTLGLSTVFFLTYFAVVVELGIIFAWLPQDLKVESSAVEGSQQPIGFSAWANYKVMVFLGNLLVYSLIHAIPEQVLFLDMEQNKSSRTMQGAATAATVLLEIPVFYYSDRLLSTYGTRGMFIRAQVACAIRLFLCSCVPRTAMYLMVPIQALHGLSYGLMWAAAIPYIQVITPPGKETFAQSLVCTIWGTMGQAIGSVLWGALYDAYSAAEVYLAGAVLTVVLLVVATLPTPNWGKLTTTPVATPLVSCMQDPSFKQVPRLATLAEADYGHRNTATP